MAHEDDVELTVSDKDLAALQALVTALNGRDRKARQSSAHTVALIAKAVPLAVIPFADDLVRAVGRPEAQTRWEALDALASLVSVDPDAAAKAFDDAQESLYDEVSCPVRLAAFRYFTVLGGASAAWSAKVWPLVDEAVQCYHGDPEFDDMLTSLLAFAQGDLDPAVRAALAERLSFDAHNGRGSLAARTRQIIEALQ